MPALTRRQAIQAGGAGAAGGYLLMHLPAPAAAADGPRHLLRSAWRDMGAREVHVGASLLRVESVGDLAAAPYVPSLRDSEDAFSLVLTGPSGLAEGDLPLRVRSQELGIFDLAVTPIGEGRYEAVVNRVLSNRESRRTPPRPQRGSGGEPAAPEKPQGRRSEATPKRRRAIRRIRASRKRSGARVVVDLAPSARVDEVAVWIKRDGRVVAAASRRVRRKGSKAVLLLKPGKRLRRGVYEVDVMATERDGEQSHRRVRVRLR